MSELVKNDLILSLFGQKQVSIALLMKCQLKQKNPRVWSHLYWKQEFLIVSPVEEKFSCLFSISWFISLFTNFGVSCPVPLVFRLEVSLSGQNNSSGVCFVSNPSLLSSWKVKILIFSIWPSLQITHSVDLCLRLG